MLNEFFVGHFIKFRLDKEHRVGRIIEITSETRSDACPGIYILIDEWVPIDIESFNRWNALDLTEIDEVEYNLISGELVPIFQTQLLVDKPAQACANRGLIK